eukprot:6192498-Pleurochrysis_carterae.AAC.3
MSAQKSIRASVSIRQVSTLICTLSSTARQSTWPCIATRVLEAARRQPMSSRQVVTSAPSVSVRAPWRALSRPHRQRRGASAARERRGGEGC